MIIHIVIENYDNQLYDIHCFDNKNSAIYLVDKINLKALETKHTAQYHVRNLTRTKADKQSKDNSSFDKFFFS